MEFTVNETKTKTNFGICNILNHECKYKTQLTQQYTNNTIIN